MHGHPKLRVFEAGRFRMRIWVQNDRKKISLHRQPLFGRGPAFYYPKRPFEWLMREGTNIPGSIDAQPKPSRFGFGKGAKVSEWYLIALGDLRMFAHVPHASYS